VLVARSCQSVVLLLACCPHCAHNRHNGLNIERIKGPHTSRGRHAQNMGVCIRILSDEVCPKKEAHRADQTPKGEKRWPGALPTLTGPARRTVEVRMTRKFICSISGCGKGGRIIRGLCGTHYQRWRKHGDALHGGEITSPGEKLRWIEEVAATYEGDECLTWPYSVDLNGRGSVWVDGKSEQASRFLCTLAHGAPPDSEHEAAHICGKGHEGCLNPRHLKWKTPAENQADRLIHGTHNRGERCGSAKLTEVQVCQIRGLRGEASHRELAERFGVSRSNIGAIQRREVWAWLSDAPSDS
jgi:hypothetical protein